MTVAELISRLTDMPQDLPVVYTENGEDMVIGDVSLYTYTFSSNGNQQVELSL